MSVLMLAVMALPLMVACSKDDDGGIGGGSDKDKVVVDENGKTSNGSIFSAIDDKNFYLDYIKYTVEEGHLVVSGYDKAGFKGVAKIVSSITYKGNTYEVLKIKNRAFDECSSMTSISIPNGVTSIGNYAFYKCRGLISVNIPSSVTTIGAEAFYGCSSLTSVNIPSSVTSIGAEAFHGCSGLTSITVESGNTVYDSRDNCNALIVTETNILKKGCTKTIIPNSVTSIGEYAFSDCSGLNSVNIPSSVTSIGYEAFAYCSGLTSLTIPNSVTFISDRAFRYCSDLTSVSIGNSVTSIGMGAFEGCNGLTSVHITDLSAWCKCENHGNPLYYAHHLYVNGEEVKDLVIPNNVTSIGYRAFYGCSGLTSITIPNSVTSIGNGAFWSCSGLTSLTIPNSVTSIGEYAFQNCSGIKSMSIGNSVTFIDRSVFEGCSGLNSVKIEKSDEPLTFGGNNPFNNCPLEELYIGRDISYNSYYSQFPFKGIKTLSSLTIGNSVTSISSWDFRDCSGLTSVKIEDCKKPLAFSTDNSFANCPLEELYMGRDISYTEYNSPFKGINTLSSLTIGNSVTAIGDKAFEGCSGLTSVSIPNSVTSIGYRAFRGCSGLTSLSIPSSVTSIGNGAFWSCSGLIAIHCLNTAPLQPADDYSSYFGDTAYSLATLYVPQGSIDAYKATYPWSFFQNIVGE